MILQMNLGRIIVTEVVTQERAMVNGAVRQVQHVVDSKMEHSRTGNGQAVDMASRV